jgi:hypothetical protein
MYPAVTTAEYALSPTLNADSVMNAWVITGCL